MVSSLFYLFNSHDLISYTPSAGCRGRHQPQPRVHGSTQDGHPRRDPGRRHRCPRCVHQWRAEHAHRLPWHRRVLYEYGEDLRRRRYLHRYLYAA